jgi:hypothetical protein
MPSTGISMCLICACDSGATARPNKSHSAIFVFTFSPFLEVRHPELLRYSKTDVPANGREHRAGGVGHVPICAYPNMQARTQTHIIRNSGEEDVTATSVLADSSYAVILHMEPSKCRSYEPLARNILRLMGPV